MITVSSHKRILAEVVGDDAVMTLIEKHGDDAIPAVFAMMIESPEWTIRESYDFVMEQYEGVFEEPSDYIAALYFEHMQKALETYAEQHQIKWPLRMRDMLNEFSWDTIAERTAGHTYFAYQTLFEDESKQYFIFKTEPKNQ